MVFTGQPVGISIVFDQEWPAALLMIDSSWCVLQVASVPRSGNIQIYYNCRCS